MNLDLKIVEQNVANALQEDLQSGDVTAHLLPPQQVVKAHIVSREPMVLCGVPWVCETFNQVDSEIEIQWLALEGAWLSAPQKICEIKGRARSILTAERTALNFLQTLSATATETYHYAKALEGYSTKILDTRKTLPGLRFAQKYAVQCGGGMNHRMGLYDAYLIKENHIKAYGSITAVIEAARQANPSLFLEIEVENLAELEEALLAKPDRIMLDNFTDEMLIEAVARNTPKITELEISGGVKIDMLVKLASLGVDYISVGAITKSIRAIDLSLRIQDGHAS